MSQSKGSLLQSKNQILHKDLSFSNQIFKKSFNSSKNKSSQSSQQNLYKNYIPPLIKYTQQTEPIHQYSTPPHLIQTNYYHQQQTVKNQNKQQQQYEELKIFERKQKLSKNKLKQFQRQEWSNYSSLPPLSRLEQKIAKKYKKEQNSNKQENINKPTKVYFDYSQDHNQPEHQNNINKVLNIESLDESRIPNHSVDKHKNWIIKDLQENSGFFEQNSLLSNLSNKNLNKKNPNRSFMNNSFRNINPLQMLSNSLHTSHLPEFVQDDDYQQQQQEQHQQKIENNMTVNLQQRLKSFNKLNNINQKQQKINQTKIPQVNLGQLTLNMFNYYVQPLLSQYNNNQFINDHQNSSIPDSILINDFDPQNKGFDLLTTKSTPIHQYSKTLTFPTKQKTVSQINQHITIEFNDFQDHSQYDNPHLNQHFIHDKTSKQLISAILSDQHKLKIYLKYLQLKISQETQNQSLCQNYELLSCLLLKINQITDKHKNLQTKTLAESIMDLSLSRRKKPEIYPESLKIKPQIIRSANGVKINFDPYLKFETQRINERIRQLKKCLQEKNKQSELIKINYDSIIQNYAATLENLSKQNYNRLQQSDKVLQSQKLYDSSYHRSQDRSLHSQKIDPKIHLQVTGLNRSSFEANKIHRKTTFGKVPSSFRGSDVDDS